MYIRYITALLTLTLVMACQSSHPDVVQEDYERLFPFTGIDQAPDLGLPVARACNPELAIENYKYLGTQPPAQGAIDYTVTLVCGYEELRYRTGSEPMPPPIGQEASRLEIRYVDASGKLVILTSDPNLSEGEDKGNALVECRKLRNGVEERISMTTRSGYPLYLSVSGTAPQGTRIRAKLEAVAADESILIPTLSTDQVQQGEGQDRLPYPYCEYIVLP